MLNPTLYLLGYLNLRGQSEGGHKQTQLTIGIAYVAGSGTYGKL